MDLTQEGLLLAQMGTTINAGLEFFDIQDQKGSLVNGNQPPSNYVESKCVCRVF